MGAPSIGIVLTPSTRFGRQQLLMLAVSSPAEMVSGKPDANVTTDVSFHPPMTLPKTPSEILATRTERQIVDRRGHESVPLIEDRQAVLAA